MVDLAWMLYGPVYATVQLYLQGTRNTRSCITDHPVYNFI